MELAMVQDEILPLEDLDSVYLDRGTFFGDGVYEVLRSYNGKIFALDEHMARFERSIREIRMDNVDIAGIRSNVVRAFERAGIPDCCIYFHVTRGSASREHSWEPDIKPNFFLTIKSLPDFTQLKQKGVKVCTENDLRWNRCDIKSLNLLANVLAKQNAHDKGCFEAILVDSRGDITEGAGSAFFAIFGKSIVTRPLGNEILPSVTRIFINKIAAPAGLDIVEKTITPWQAMNADELFLGVTTKDVLGIVEFDGRPISGGQVGPYTRRLEEEFRNLIKTL